MKNKIYSIHFNANLGSVLPIDLTGFAIVAANSAEEAETLLKTQSDVRHSDINIVEMVLLPGCEYEGEPVLIKEYNIYLNDK